MSLRPLGAPSNPNMAPPNLSKSAYVPFIRKNHLISCLINRERRPWLLPLGSLLRLPAAAAATSPEALSLERANWPGFFGCS